MHGIFTYIHEIMECHNVMLLCYVTEKYACRMCPAGIQAADSVTHYAYTLNYSRSTFTLHLRRKYLYYLIHLIIPYCLFSWLAIFTFILQPSRPERLNIGMTLPDFLLISLILYFPLYR